MPERQPVRAVGEKGKAGVGLAQAVRDPENPLGQAAEAGTDQARQQAEFPVEGDGREAAQGQAEDEQRQPEAYPAAQGLGLSHSL